MTAAVDAPRSAATPAATPLVDAWSLAVVVLGALGPILAFLASNATKLVHPAPVIAVAIGWTIVLVALFVLARFLTRRVAPHIVAVGVVAVNLSFWNFGRWLSVEPGSMSRRLVELAVWGVVTVLFTVLAVKLARIAGARTFLVVFLALWVVTSVVGYATGSSQRAAGDQPTTYTAPIAVPFETRPNVYWLVLDEHARSDQLRTWTGEDNSWFSDDLADRGFAVSESTWTGYVHTHLSLSSTLAMDYAFTPGHDYHGEYALTAPISAGDNPVVETFEANGYRYVYAPDGSVEWSTCPPPKGDRVCIDPVNGVLGMREPYAQLVWSTPVGALPLPLTHNDFDSVLDGVEQVRAGTDQPLFVMGHVLSPHQPYRYEPDCSPRSEPVVGTKLSGPERAAAYGNEVQCVDHDAVDAVDRILASDPGAVIIVQSDHGSRLSFNWDQPYEQWTPAMLQERFAALNAIRLPPSCADRSIEGQPLVNTFRLVFACLSGTEPELLDTRRFFSGYGQISSLVEVPPERFEDR